jgi:excinuclease ABC subunit C
MSGLALPLIDTARLHRKVAALAENRPGVYRMLDHLGRIIYVGKAKRVRTRLLTYFRAAPPEKAARILESASDITWDYQPSEFAACLGELRDIRRHRPAFNVRMNRTHRAVFVKVSSGPAPKVYLGATPGDDDIRHYGPFTSPGRVALGVRVLNDLLGLRDCALAMPIVYAEQGDLFGPTRRAACMRHELGTCTGPCGGFVSAGEYRSRVSAAIAFLEARGAAPLDRVVREMADAGDANEFERATRWRDKFDALEWLFAASIRARATLEALSFVFYEPGAHGDDRVYVIRRATVRASAPAPRTPIEREAFKALVAEHSGAEPAPGPIPVSQFDETMLIWSWFRRHPGAIRRTTPFDRWATLAPAPSAA